MIQSSEESKCASDNQVEDRMAGNETSIKDDLVEGYARQLLCWLLLLGIVKLILLFPKFWLIAVWQFLSC